MWKMIIFFYFTDNKWFPQDPRIHRSHTKSVGIHVSVSCWKKVVPLHLHWTYNIYILQFKRGSENQPINRPLSAGTPKSNCVASTRRLAEGISHAPWSLVALNGLCTASTSKLPTFFQLLDATCKFKKKKEKWSHSKFTKKFQHHFKATCTSATILWNQKTLVYVATVRVFELATVVSPLRPTVPVPVRNWPVPLQKGGVVGHGKDMLMLSMREIWMPKLQYLAHFTNDMDITWNPNYLGIVIFHQIKETIISRPSKSKNRFHVFPNR